MRARVTTAAIAVAAVASLGGCGTADLPAVASPSPYSVIYPLHAGLPSIATVSFADLSDRAEVYCAQYGRFPAEASEFTLDGMAYVQYDCVIPAPPAAPAPAPAPVPQPLVPAAAS